MFFNGNIIYKHDIFQQAMSDYQMVHAATLHGPGTWLCLKITPNQCEQL